MIAASLGDIDNYKEDTVVELDDGTSIMIDGGYFMPTDDMASLYNECIEWTKGGITDSAIRIADGAPMFHLRSLADLARYNFNINPDPTALADDHWYFGDNFVSHENPVIKILRKVFKNSNMTKAAKRMLYRERTESEQEEAFSRTDYHVRNVGFGSDSSTPASKRLTKESKEVQALV